MMRRLLHRAEGFRPAGTLALATLVWFVLAACALSSHTGRSRAGEPAHTHSASATASCCLSGSTFTVRTPGCAAVSALPVRPLRATPRPPVLGDCFAVAQPGGDDQAVPLLPHGRSVTRSQADLQVWRH